MHPNSFFSLPDWHREDSSVYMVVIGEEVRRSAVGCCVVGIHAWRVRYTLTLLSAGQVHALLYVVLL